MEITWHDNTCFTLREKGASIVINPEKNAKLTGEMVFSSDGSEATAEGMEKLFDWPGEFEMRGVPVNAIPAGTKAELKDTMIFVFTLGGVKVCHLGELGHALTNEMVSQIGDVDVLMIKVGEGSNLTTKQATEIIEAIEPRSVIPMGTKNPAEALKEIGADKVEAIDKFVLKGTSDLPDDQMKYVVLKKA